MKELMLLLSLPVVFSLAAHTAVAGSKKYDAMCKDEDETHHFIATKDNVTVTHRTIDPESLAYNRRNGVPSVSVEEYKVTQSPGAGPRRYDAQRVMETGEIKYISLFFLDNEVIRDLAVMSLYDTLVLADSFTYRNCSITIK